LELFDGPLGLFETWLLTAALVGAHRLKGCGRLAIAQGLSAADLVVGDVGSS